MLGILLIGPAVFGLAYSATLVYSMPRASDTEPTMRLIEPTMTLVCGSGMPQAVNIGDDFACDGSDGVVRCKSACRYVDVTDHDYDFDYAGDVAPATVVAAGRAYRRVQ